MNNTYTPHTIEIAALQHWEANKSFVVTEENLATATTADAAAQQNSSQASPASPAPQTSPTSQTSHASPAPREKFYCLSMLPYPSGQIHMGHVRNYTISDVIARYMRMRGKNVLQPLGWDAFGLPAENAALEHKLAPAAWTYRNIKEMRTTIKRLGFAIDWTREIATCKPEYYRWEQLLFLRMYAKGLAYKKKSVVNWDPVDQTVLANEQVVDGRGWRSGALVERREIAQWFLKITAYADELLRDLDKLTGWPEEVRTMQRNWIGRSEGVEFSFALTPASKGKIATTNITNTTTTTQNTAHDAGKTAITDKITVFTTRPDTLCGVTYLAIAAEHPLAIAVATATNNSALTAFIKKQQNVKVAEAELATLPKEGVDTGLTVVHPISGASIPVWVANFVLMEYGSGAVMSVPAHDQRDFEFAAQYGLPLKPVIAPADSSVWDYAQTAFTAKGVLYDSYIFSDLTSEAACTAIATHLEQRGIGTRKVHYRLRDWGVSRQRYWGTPIPMINCPKCGTVPVPIADLPVVLPEDVTLDNPQSPLTKLQSFLHTTCPQCGGAATRETDTFDTFMESSWYYARYCCPDQNQSMFDQRIDYWMPVDQYIGGIEHAIMHLLYARFIYKVLRDEGLVRRGDGEPFLSLLTQGMVLKGGSKMSKSKGNTVSPHTIIEKYGADTARLFIIFAAPPAQALEWSDSGVEGAYRFLKKLWHFAYEQQQLCRNINATRAPATTPATTNDSTNATTSSDQKIKKMRHQLHTILQQANDDMQRKQFNTVVSAAMKILHLLHDMADNSNTTNTMDATNAANAMDTTTAAAPLIYEGMSILLRLLAPITPHITHHLWQELHFAGDIIDATWPSVDTQALAQDTVDMIVQVNGKYRAKITVPHNASQQMARELALACENVQRFIGDPANIEKIVVVPGKLVNIVGGSGDVVK